jgi:hypothetical protein
MTSKFYRKAGNDSSTGRYNLNAMKCFAVTSIRGNGDSIRRKRESSPLGNQRPEVTISVIRDRLYVGGYVVHEFVEFILQGGCARRFSSDIPGQVLERA